MIFKYFAYGTVFLLGIVFLISLWVILKNLYSINRETSRQIKRTQLRLGILSYLSDETVMNELLITINQSPELISGVLGQLASNISLEDKPKLDALLNHPAMLAIISREVKKLNSRNWHVRQRAATYLPYLCAAEKISEALIIALEDKHDEVRVAAALSLAQLKESHATAKIINSLTYSNAIPWARTLEVVLQMGPAAKEPLIEILEDSNASERAKTIAVAYLGIQRSQGTSALIQRFSDSKDINLRIQSAKALGILHESSSLETLINGMQDNAWEVRAMSAQALGNFSQHQALEILEKNLGDPAYWVRYNCANALMSKREAGMLVLRRNLDNQDKFIRDICNQSVQTMQMNASLSAPTLT